MKHCRNCKVEKEFKEFSESKTRKDGLQPECKACVKAYQKINAESINEYQKEYRKANAESMAEKSKEYRKANAESIAEYKKEYYKANAASIIEYKKEYQKTKRKINPMYKFRCDVRSLTSAAFKRRKLKKGSKTQALLGCTFEELAQHLEKQFQEGMTLANHGEWHIDHIIPLASAKTKKQVEKLCHYTNLQPLWAVDNMKKGAKT